MAPNRKAHAVLLEASFAPLSNYVKQSTNDAVVGKLKTVERSSEPLSAAATYWNWPADEALATITQEEKIRMLFSADRITANLVAAAVKFAKAETERQVSTSSSTSPLHVVVKPKVNYDSDAYWYMKRASKNPDVVENDWTSADHIEATLVESCADATDESKDLINFEDEIANAYWEYPAWKAQGKEIKQRLLQEHLLALLSTSHIVDNLLLARQCAQSHAINTMDSNSIEPNYWVF
jgi:hypothetical protein